MGRNVVFIEKNIHYNEDTKSKFVTVISSESQILCQIDMCVTNGFKMFCFNIKILVLRADSNR